MLTALLLVAVAPPPASAGTSPGTLVAPPRAHTFGVRRVTARELRLFFSDVDLVEPGGISAVRLLATDDPDDSTDDDEITVVAVDRGGGWILTNYGLLDVATWTGAESPVGALEKPWDVAIDRDGRVLVTDPGRRRVVLLQHDGSSIEAVRAFDGFLEPTGVASDGVGGFWICDRRFNTVFHLDPETGHRSTLGLEVAFDRPIDVAAAGAGERLARGHSGGVLVADRDGERLRLFGPDGELRAMTDGAALGRPEYRFDAVEIDHYGNVLAVDRAGHRVHKFREDLLPLDTFGREGTRVGEFVEPRGIAVNRRLGQVFITERTGGQYLWVGTDVKDFAFRDQGDSAEMSFRLVEESTVDLKVLDAQGKAIADVFGQRRLSAGPHVLQWDGRTAKGTPAGRGDYLVEIRARATYASRSTYEHKVLKPITLGIGEDGRR